MRHTLPGRPQSSRQALCTVNWDGLRLVAYISGSTVIVFNGRREILQSISVDDAGSLLSLTIEEGSGHIAVCNKSTVYIYHPLGRDYGDLRWSLANTLTPENEAGIAYLSWGSSDELLAAGQCMTLWSFAEEHNPQAIWSSELSSPVAIAAFSPDGGLIASCGQYDRMVKVWRRLSYEQDSTRFDVSYLPHPSSITNLFWRRLWHQEQNLDNLLYTFCADNQVRVWAHSEHHACSTLQEIVTIDTSASIQPRRLSTGSMSKTRFSFMLESRDLARAAERALQIHPKGVDHALEHLIEIANRAPEVCIILDGLGHMSAWGVENAGLKNKLDPEKFNVALVDGVDIALPTQLLLDDFAQIHTFANNDLSASLCILVHSYSGQIDWYQGSFVEFFDTSHRSNRVHLLSCFSGHDTTVDSLVPSLDRQSFLSLTEDDQVTLWSQSSTGALVRAAETQLDFTVLHAVLLAGNAFAAFLSESTLSIWDLRGRPTRIGTCDLGHKQPRSLCQLRQSSLNSQQADLVVLHEDCYVEYYRVQLPNQRASSQANGYHKSIDLTCSSKLRNGIAKGRINFCDQSSTVVGENAVALCSWSADGFVEITDIACGIVPIDLPIKTSLATHVPSSTIAAALTGHFFAVAHANRRSFSIWNLSQGAAEFIYNFQKELSYIQKLSWHKTPDGLILLAVQFGYNVAIIRQQRYEADENKPAWRLQQIVQTRTHSGHFINSMCWLDPHQIVLGLGNQIFTFDVDEDHDQSESAPADDAKILNADSGGQLRLDNSSLAVYNPQILASILQVGQYHTVYDILHSLHNELKFLVPGEYVDLNPAEVLHSMSSSNHIAITGDDGVGTKLEELLPQLQQNITKMPLQQLCSPQRNSLLNLIHVNLQFSQSRKSMDDYALTYLFHFLSTVSDTDPSKAELKALPWSAIVHASLSQTQESLLNYVLAQLEERNIKLTWSTARSLGLFLFVSDIETLKLQFESVARAEYNRNQDDRNPVDCSLYYLALNKKAVLQSLWRRTIGVKEREATLKLLAHDFSQQKPRATALKNAYALLSRRRFEYAAAFFLLGGSLADAVNVCVNQLHDIQLAIAIARVWQGDISVQQKVMSNLIDKTISEFAIETHEARWLAVWGRNYSEDWHGAIRYIVRPIDQLFEKQFAARRSRDSEEEKKGDLPFAAMSFRSNEPTLLINMYKHLRSRLHQANAWTAEVITPKEEWAFILRCVEWYTRAGMDWLALQLVANWEFVEWQGIKRKVPVSPSSLGVTSADGTETVQKSVLDDWLVPREVPTKEPPKVDVQQEQSKQKPKPPPTQFVEPSADSLLDSFGF